MGISGAQNFPPRFFLFSLFISYAFLPLSPSLMHHIPPYPNSGAQTKPSRTIRYIIYEPDTVPTDVRSRERAYRRSEQASQHRGVKAKSVGVYSLKVAPVVRLNWRRVLILSRWVECRRQHVPNASGRITNA